MSDHSTTWQSIHAEALARIRSGAWPSGELIPNETDLAQEFSCARMTVSRALRQLADDGVLDRKRRAGTRVAQTPVRRATLSIPVIRQEIEARGQAYRHRVLTRSTTVPPEPIAARLGLAGNADLLHLVTLHMADGRPYVAEDRWINPIAVPGILEASLDDISANEWLVRHAHYSDGEIAFSAAPATQAHANLLDTDPGAALFIIDRVTWIGDIPVTAVQLAYAPGHRMTTSL